MQGKRSLRDLIQSFNDEAYADPGLQKLVSEYYLSENLTGIKDEILLRKIFDYMDNKLQAEIRSNLQKN